MKKNRVILLVLISLSVIAAVLIFSQSKSTISRELKDFAINDTASVVKIFLADKNDNTVLLERQEDNSWLVNGKYKVRRDMIDLLLSTSRNLRVVAPVPKAAFNTVVTNMATRNTKVEIYQRHYMIDLLYRIRLFPRVRLAKVYYIGDVTPDNIGTHMLLEGSSMPFIVHWPGFRGFVASRYSTRENDWRDHTIFGKKYNQIESIEVFFPSRPEQSYRIINSDDGFLDLIPHGKSEALPAYDTLKMLGFITAFEDIRYEALIDDMLEHVVDSITSSQPQHIITLVDKRGKRQQAKTFRRQAVFYAEDLYGQSFDYDPDRMFALINDGEDFVLVQYFTFNRIIRPLQFFMP